MDNPSPNFANSDCNTGKNVKGSFKISKPILAAPNNVSKAF